VWGWWRAVWYEVGERRQCEAATEDKLAAKMEKVAQGKHWRSPNFDRRVLAPAYQAADWRDADGNGTWTWGTHCGMFSVLPRCSPGSSTPLTCPAWPATPTTASPSTCTSSATAGVLNRARKATE
jgi:hypothetical protein